MIYSGAVDILLVEDNPRDVELITRALTKRNLANRLFVVEDGAEALLRAHAAA
jgi:CheY-like chemotaxis protein